MMGFLRTNAQRRAPVGKRDVKERLSIRFFLRIRIRFFTTHPGYTFNDLIASKGEIPCKVPFPHAVLLNPLHSSFLTPYSFPTVPVFATDTADQRSFLVFGYLPVLVKHPVTHGAVAAH